MITVPTHKCHKSPFRHSKTIYIFTSGRVILTVQIHGRTKLLKVLKWPLQNGPSIPESSRICAILLQDFMKRSVCWCGGGDAVTVFRAIEPGSTYLRTLAASTIIQLFVEIVWKFKNLLFSKNKNLWRKIENRMGMFYFLMWNLQI